MSVPSAASAQAAAPGGAPPMTLALELRRGVVFADEAHRHEASSWVQFSLDPRTKGGLHSVLNNESLASELKGSGESSSSSCLAFVNDTANQAFYLQCLAVLQQNGWKVQTSYAYSTSSLTSNATVIFTKDHDNIAETVRATMRRSIKLGQLDDIQHAFISNHNNEQTLQRRSSTGKIDTRPLRSEPPTPVARESITIQPATPLPLESRALRRVDSAPSQPLVQHHIVQQAVAQHQPPPPPPPTEARTHRRIESAPVQPPPPAFLPKGSHQGPEDARPPGRLSVKNAAAALAGTIGKVAMTPNPYAAGGPFRPQPRPQPASSHAPGSSPHTADPDPIERQSIDIHPTMKRPTLRTQRRARSVEDSRGFSMQLSAAGVSQLNSIQPPESDIPPPPPPPPTSDELGEIGPIEDVVPQIGQHNPNFDQSGKLLLSPKNGGTDRKERENQFFARLKAQEEEHKRQQLADLGEEELQKLKVEEDAKSEREGLKTAHFARLGRPLVGRTSAKRAP